MFRLYQVQLYILQKITRVNCEKKMLNVSQVST